MRNISFAITIMLLCAAPGSRVRAAVLERQLIDAFDYRDDATAQAAWIPVEGSLRATVLQQPLLGHRGLRLPCDLTGPRRRAAWDHAVQLDLSRVDRFSYWLYVDDPNLLAANFSFYFGSGEGWYSASFSAEQGWQRITLDKASFSTEGTPAGWNQIKGIRLSAWKAKDAVTFVAVDDLEASASAIAIVMGNVLPNNQTDDEASPIRAQAQLMRNVLLDIGVEPGVLTDQDVASGALQGRKIAIFAFSPHISEPEAQAIETFIDAGGKAILFYSSPPRVLKALGLRETTWRRQEYDGQFASIHFPPRTLEGMPVLVQQASWNMLGVTPVGHNARIIGEWYDVHGKATGLPALAISDNGAFMTHVLLADDRPGKQKLMLALLGHFMPDLWPQAAQRALDASSQVGEYATLDGISALIQKSQKASALARLTAARRLLAQASMEFDQKRYAAAVALAQDAHQEIVAGYALAQVSRPNEMRAVWCHSAFGVAGMTWDEAIKTLAHNGMNAVMPNMLWGGRAYYKSQILPVDESVATQGDQIANCLAAGKKYGVQVHVWKVNWNLSNAPRAFLEQMRAAGRTQKDPQGKDLDWLCPSHPANFALERAAMLEIVRNYDVAGIHFDYIRYPGPEGCYCEGCKQRFEKAYGVTVMNWPGDVVQGALRPQYLDFRRANITRLVEAVSTAAHRLKPQLKVSAAVFPNWPECRDSVGQDWVKWIKQGYLDFVCPMNYTDKPQQLSRLIEDQMQATQHAIPYCPGIGVTLGDWTLTGDQTIQQINVARQHHTDGFILFNYGPAVVADILPGLHAGVTAENSTMQGTPTRTLANGQTIP